MAIIRGGGIKQMKNIVYKDASLFNKNMGYMEYSRHKDKTHHYRVKQAIEDLKSTGNILVYYKKNNRKPLRLIYSKLNNYKLVNKESSK